MTHFAWSHYIIYIIILNVWGFVCGGGVWVCVCVFVCPPVFSEMVRSHDLWNLVGRCSKRASLCLLGHLRSSSGVTLCAFLFLTYSQYLESFYIQGQTTIQHDHPSRSIHNVLGLQSYTVLLHNYPALYCGIWIFSALNIAAVKWRHTFCAMHWSHSGLIQVALD